MRGSIRPGSIIYIGATLIGVIHHQRNLLVIPDPIPSALAVFLLLILVVQQSHIERTAQDETAPRYAPCPRRRVEDHLVKREREQHLRVDHVGRPAALLMLQARRECELHDEPADAEGGQIDPLAQVDGQSEVDARRRQERHGTDDDGPACVIVHQDQGVRALADPTDGGDCG